MGCIASHLPILDRAHSSQTSCHCHTQQQICHAGEIPQHAPTARCWPSSAHGRAGHRGNHQQNTFQCYWGNFLSSFSSGCCCGSMSLFPGAVLHVCNLPDCGHRDHVSHSECDTSLSGSLALIFGGLSRKGNLEDRKGNISGVFPSGAVLKRFWKGCTAAELPSAKAKDGFPL